MKNNRFKYKNKTIYQIYVQSFKDSNADGIGDIKGIESKLDYLKTLGVDYIWLTPIFKSPMHDNGYDVADYYELQDVYGTKNDLKSLLDNAHNKGMKVILDIVFNHTSNEHEWFKRALSGEKEYQDYYHFFEKDSRLVNHELRSVFNEPAFVFDEKLQKYYFAAFSKYQPDINWDNPKVRHELHKIVNYWKTFGFDGFRLDVYAVIDKEWEKLAKADNIWAIAENKNVLTYWKEVLEDFRDSIHITAEANSSAFDALRHTGENGPITSMFTFDHLDCKWYNGGFNANQWFGKYFNKILEVNDGGGEIALPFDNHDNPRVIDSFLQGNENYFTQISTAINVLNAFQNGTAVFYQGNEIGLKNPTFNSKEQLVDIESKNSDNPQIIHRSRDNARTPLRWNKSNEFFGFSSKTPWLTNAYHNQEFDSAESKYITSEFIKTINIRKKYNQFHDWKMELIKNENNYIEYLIKKDDKRLRITFNFSSNQQPSKHSQNIIYSNYFNGNRDVLEPFEIRVNEEKND